MLCDILNFLLLHTRFSPSFNSFKSYYGLKASGGRKELKKWHKLDNTYTYTHTLAVQERGMNEWMKDEQLLVLFLISQIQRMITWSSLKFYAICLFMETGKFAIRRRKKFLTATREKSLQVLSSFWGHIETYTHYILFLSPKRKHKHTHAHVCVI